MEVMAKLKYARVGAQKARLVADLVRGKGVNDAIRTLTFAEKKAGSIIRKLLQSAIANAEQKKVIDIDSLYVKKITVDGAPMLYRFISRAQGRATPIRKKQSHINVVLDER